MTTNAMSGDFIQVAVNGWEITEDMETMTYQHTLAPQALGHFNTGVHQTAPGIYRAALGLNGFVQRGQGVIRAYNLFTNATDTDYITLAAIGNNAAPVEGDDCIVYDGTLLEYTRPTEIAGLQKWQATFKPRGVRVPAFPKLLINASQTGSCTSAVYDDGAESVDTTNGAIGVLEVLTPTGTCASVTCGTAAQPANGNAYAFGVDGTTYTYTWTTAATPTASTVIVGSDPADSYKNLFYAMVGDPSQSGVKFGASVTALPTTKVTVSTPTAADVITLTALNSGTAANAWTAACTGATLNVSSTAFGGGLAGETATIVIQSATTSGGSYSTVVTFTKDMTTRGAEIITVQPGTVISRYLKCIVTMSASTMTWAARIAFGRWFPGQAG